MATENFVQQSGQQPRHLFLGWQTEIERFMPLLDFLVVPSLWPETFGRVAAEAQACGVPVIVTAAGGLVEALLPGRTGLLLDSQPTSVSLGHAVESLARDPALRLRMGIAGVEFVRSHFGAQQIAAAFIENLRCAPSALPAWTPAPESDAPADSVMSHVPLGN
jgi:glycosyltransferase involved in cell wall biosynthesis